MKILVVVHGFPPAAEGGAEIYAQAHARALHSLFGDDVLVLTREADQTRPEYDVRTEHRDGLRIVWVNHTYRQTRRFADTYRSEEIGAIAGRLIDEFAPDIAHVHHLTHLSTAIVSALAASGIPCFFTLHDYWLLCHRGQLLDVNLRACEGPEPSGCRACLGPAAAAGPAAFLGARLVRELERHLPGGRRVRQLAERLYAVAPDSYRADDEARKRFEHMRAVCDNVTQFVAPSRFMRDRFVRFGVPPERIIVSGNGIDTSGPRARPHAFSSRLRIGFLGSLTASKAPHVLLEAFRQLPSGSASVDLYGAFAPYHGDDSYRHTLAPLLRLAGVTVHGAIPHDRVPEALSSIDVLVVPSIWPENSPSVVREARLAGVAVVASRIGGIPEMIDDGRDGLLFRSGDSADLARVLASLIEDPDRLASLTASRRPIRSIEDDARAVRALYEAHVRRPAARRRLAAVLLNFRAVDDTLLAVKSLVASDRPLDDIFVVDNGSSDRLRDAAPHPRVPVTYVRNSGNLGFSGGMNVGIREAIRRGADRVLLVNSDAIVPPDCCALLERCLEKMPRAGIAAPVILSRSQPDRVESTGISYATRSGRMKNEGCGRRITLEDRAPARIVDAVSGCVMLVRREVFDAIGLFDEDYFFGFEDVAFCLKARTAGFATVVEGRALAYHEGGRSIGAASPRRLYFAARNHLLLARRTGVSGSMAKVGRTVSIVGLNLAHAIVAPGGSPVARLGAVVKGTRDFLAGRFGPDE